MPDGRPDSKSGSRPTAADEKPSARFESAAESSRARATPVANLARLGRLSFEQVIAVEKYC